MAKLDIEGLRLRDQLAAIAVIEDGPSRDGAPVRWWLTPTWRCTNLHVSGYYYRKGFNRRFCTFKFCESAVQLTFPGDHSGPLAPLRPATGAPAGAQIPVQRVTELDWAE